jgi:hypothetical protein
MNRLAIACLFLAFAATAQAGAPAADGAAADAPMATAAADADAGKDENVTLANDVEKPEAVADTGCVRESGTRLRRRADANGCNGQPGTSYTRDDLLTTGGSNTADALKMLDTRL